MTINKKSTFKSITGVEPVIFHILLSCSNHYLSYRETGCKLSHFNYIFMGTSPAVIRISDVKKLQRKMVDKEL